MPDKTIYITQPDLPPLAELTPFLENIWASRHLSNNGPYHQAFEEALAEYLGVGFISLFCNATIALVTALQALDLTGEVITTPFSFPATSHALMWNGIQPVFVDIDSDTLNMNVEHALSAITPQTTGILPMHCYGQPCDVHGLRKVADEHDLRILYDAAHAFKVDCHGESVLNFGDLSVISFHATKVFNTFEGGAIVSPDAETKLHVDRLKNFGFVDEQTVVAAGINGKMSEFNAALGLLQLKYADEYLHRRAQLAGLYKDRLRGVAGLRVVDSPNNSYFPILVDEEFPLSRDELYTKFRAHEIWVRRYFSPLLTEFPMYRNLPSYNPDNLSVARAAAANILCLPLYPGLTESDQNRVLAVLESA
ncbi:MAG: DegT/DnrJ/EryC1/StrS family aminotransferase [Halioglobus sp.]